jgi:hypothetical protein
MKIYLFAAAGIAAAVFFAYLAGAAKGGADARADCARRIAETDALKTAAVIDANARRAMHAAEQKRKINEETYSTAASAIRVRLREKYTISD